MTIDASAAPPGRPLALLRAAHGGPAVAVTVIASLLSAASGRPATTTALVTAAVLAGQLTIGWGNDLLDAGRDRTVGRVDKPLATGELTRATVLAALAAAAVCCVVLSALLGTRAGLLHLLVLVGAGHAYNLGLKATALSWLPYAAAFGALPAVAALAGEDGGWPPWWTMAAGATLGVGAHFLNTLPDLADDERTGVRGLPHRLGAPASRLVAAGLLAGASVLAALGPAGPPAAWALTALVVVAALTVVTLRGTGRAPFQAAVAIALVDVVMLVAAGR